MIFSRRMSGSALAAALLTIPADRESVRGGPRATIANGEGSYGLVARCDSGGHGVHAAIDNMFTRTHASTRAT